MENVTNFSSLGLKDVLLCSRDQKHWLKPWGEVAESKYHALIGDNSWDRGRGGGGEMQWEKEA